MNIPRVVIVIVVITLLFSSSALSTTRSEVIAKAQNEANRTYYSCAADDTTRIMDNVYHENYFEAYLERGCSPINCILYEEWPFSWDGWPQQHTWQGAPYCYGGPSMGETCQNRIYDGYGVGATPCQYLAIGQTKNWAAEIDCSHFVCACLGIPYANTSALPGVCEKISWDELKKGDLLIWPGEHVMMFYKWENPEKTTYSVFHASIGGYGGKRVWKQEGREKKIDKSFYSPYTPEVIAGDLAAAVVGFRAVLMDGIPHLIWDTECERETRAFWIERAPHAEGPWERISDPVPARGTATSGADYLVVDMSGSSGRAYYRLIEQEVGWRTIVEAVAMLEEEVSDRTPWREIRKRREGGEHQ